MTADKTKDATRFLRGSSFLEKEMFQLYQNLAQKTEYADIRYLLVGLAYDSLKHAKILAEIGKHFVKLKTIPELSQKVNELSGEVSKKEKMTIEDLSFFVRRAADLEDLLSEKYIALLALENLQYVVNKLSKMTPVDVRALRSIFSGLVKDKETHRNLLIEFQYFVLAKKSEKARDNAPFVKYNNPGS
jgi:rubrerythrin